MSFDFELSLLESRLFFSAYTEDMQHFEAGKIINHRDTITHTHIQLKDLVHPGIVGLKEPWPKPLTSPFYLIFHQN